MFISINYVFLPIPLLGLQGCTVDGHKLEVKLSERAVRWGCSNPRGLLPFLPNICTLWDVPRSAPAAEHVSLGCALLSFARKERRNEERAGAGPQKWPRSEKQAEFSSLLKEKASALVTVQAALQAPGGLKSSWRQIFSGQWSFYLSIWENRSSRIILWSNPDKNRFLAW